MNNDLISRSALKKEVENLVAGGAERLKDYYENGSKREENEWIGGVYDAWELIDNAPTVNEDMLAEDVIKVHENIGYEKGFRDGYAQCITDKEERKEHNRLFGKEDRE